jgi:hypothetical protein
MFTEAHKALELIKHLFECVCGNHNVVDEGIDALTARKGFKCFSPRCIYQKGLRQP